MDFMTVLSIGEGFRGKSVGTTPGRALALRAENLGYGGVSALLARAVASKPNGGNRRRALRRRNGSRCEGSLRLAREHAAHCHDRASCSRRRGRAGFELGGDRARHLCLHRRTRGGEAGQQGKAGEQFAEHGASRT